MKTRKIVKISVLMAVYNGGSTVVRTIRSILAQNFKNFEFIIIDDGSNDETPTLLKSFIDERIRVISLEQNIGLTKCLNIGIKESKGKYIARIDADDECFPNRLEEQLKFMEKNPQVGVCGSNVIYKTNGFKQNWKFPEKNSQIKAQLHFKNAIAHPTVLIRKKILLENNIFYNEDLRYAQDFNLWIRLFDKTQFHNIQIPLVYYNRTVNSISTKKRVDQINCSVQSLKLFYLAKYNVEISQAEAKNLLNFETTINRNDFSTIKEKISLYKLIKKIIKRADPIQFELDKFVKKVLQKDFRKISIYSISDLWFLLMHYPKRLIFVFIKFEI